VTTKIGSEMQSKIGSLGDLLKSRALEATEQVRMSPIDRIKPGRHQPRTQFRKDSLDDLAGSIRESGVIEPLIVSAIDDGNYELLGGERRWRAAQMAGLTEVPVIIRSPNDADAVNALVLNLQREDLCLADEIAAVARLIAQLGSVRAVGKKLGMREQWVSARHVLATAPPVVQEQIASGRMRDVEALLRLARHAKNDEASTRKAVESYQPGTPLRDHIETSLGKPMLRTARNEGRAEAGEPTKPATPRHRRVEEDCNGAIHLTKESTLRTSADRKRFLLRSGTTKVVFSAETDADIARFAKAISQLTPDPSQRSAGKTARPTSRRKRPS
jgi:ParB/RepB/Spo0J family partition protein